MKGSTPNQLHRSIVQNECYLKLVAVSSVTRNLEGGPLVADIGQVIGAQKAHAKDAPVYFAKKAMNGITGLSLNLACGLACTGAKTRNFLYVSRDIHLTIRDIHVACSLFLLLWTLSHTANSMTMQ